MLHAPFNYRSPPCVGHAGANCRHIPEVKFACPNRSKTPSQLVERTSVGGYSQWHPMRPRDSKVTSDRRLCLLWSLHLGDRQSREQGGRLSSPTRKGKAHLAVRCCFYGFKINPYTTPKKSTSTRGPASLRFMLVFSRHRVKLRYLVHLACSLKPVYSTAV